ncbi:transglycosylase domain-containing protein [Enterococcus sp. CSURQ0835]|uniref:transglycosylase domain-containing protein n=1 Tax=Enterococcus sp. CSURQ0835 TaxID=2681394 RepID=UPI00135ADE9C|nr:transglycosylase domain-containing protein [Enterococcus sp. CSURQ0835]
MAQTRQAKHSGQKWSKATKISLSVLGALLVIFLVAGLYFVHTYGKQVTAAIDEGQEKAATVEESDFKQYRPTTILDANGQTIKQLKTQERDYITYKELDPKVSEALIAIEDRRFYEHHGVDTQGLLTVALNAMIGRGVRGASTITQQLVKNIYLTPEVSVSRKVEEMVMAQALEKKFSKHQILEYYLNNVYFGHGAYGINAASRVYFNKPINDTTLLEKATLVGITNNPGIFDPVTQKANAKKRALVILKQMLDQGYITKQDYQKAQASDFTAHVHSDALDNDIQDNEIALTIDSATKILMNDEGFRFQYQFDSKDEEKRYNKDYKEAYNKVYQRIMSGGYEIKTKIDPTIHQELQQIVTNTMAKWTEKDKELYTKQAAMTVIDNQTGTVVASIGGRGEAGNTYNRAFLSFRQPGSAIKPLVSFAPAYERGLLETSKISDDRPNNTYPNNVYLGSKGDLTLRHAMAVSSNVVAFKLAAENSKELEEPVYHPLAQMQFSGLDPADNNPIIAVGGMTYGATTQEMASGIATLVNQGNFRLPTNITNITRKDQDKEIFSLAEAPQKKVYSDDAAYLTLDTMKGVHQEADGTAAGMTLAHNQYWAVKTGTTDEAKDLWTVGATPYYTVAVWAGNDTPKAQNNEVVGQATKDIFKQTMDLLNAGKADKDFPRPASVEESGGQLITRSSQAKQMLTNRKNALQNDSQQINAAVKAKANELVAAKLNSPAITDATNFSSQIVSERINDLSQFEIVVTDTQDNWTDFDHLAQKVNHLTQTLEPNGGTLTRQYQTVYDAKEDDYQKQKASLNTQTDALDQQIDRTKQSSKDLDKQIEDLREAIDKENAATKSSD